MAASHPDPSVLFAWPRDVSVLGAMDLELRTRTVQRWLCRALGDALGVPPAHRVRADRPLRVLGVDALLALHLKRQLEQILHVRLKAHDLLREDTPAQLAAQLAELAARPAAAAVSVSDESARLGGVKRWTARATRSSS
ncbi:acyl carrier protein [Streptomyces sp. NPDC029674]|uniref:acyl carrier protein n=1 Tax=Streptomyces sp. NPDC029674 TaxID=3365297 RepID=UPI003850CB4E